MPTTTAAARPLDLSARLIRAGAVLLSALGAASGLVLLTGSPPAGSALSVEALHGIGIGLLVLGGLAPLVPAWRSTTTTWHAALFALALFAHGFCLSGQVALWPQRPLSLLACGIALVLAAFSAVSTGSMSDPPAKRRM